MSQKLRPLVLSLLFLLASAGTYQVGTQYLRPALKVVSAQTIDSPAGTWQQYVIDDGKPFYLGTFKYERQDGDMNVVAIDVGPDTFPQSDFRTFGHTYDGKTWGFHSDWHEYGVAWFQLNRVGENRFEGYAHLDGHQRPSRHILIRVSE